MPLLRTRPKIRVRVPRSVTPGVRFSLEVLLDARREVDVDAVRVTIVGRVWSRAHQTQVEVLRLGATPEAPRPLPSGTTSLRVDAVLPERVPPTYRGTGLQVDWEVEVHASVPWWPDAHARFELLVAAVPNVTPTSPTTLFATREGGPAADQPYAELSLGSREIAPRGVLRGALAVYGTEQHRYQKATLALRALEGGGFARPGATWPGPAWTITVPLAGARDGDAVPFAIGVPELVPSFSAEMASLDWALGVEISTAWSRALSFEIPMFVTAATGASAARNVDAYPPLGEERVRRVWSTIAQRHGLELVGDALRGTVGGVELRVHRGRGARGGAEIVAALEHAPLHLGLTVARRSLGSRLFERGARSGFEAFDAGHEISGRSAEQVVAWMSRIVPLLGTLRVGGIADTSMRLTLGDSGTSERPLDHFVGASLLLARGLDAALAHVPPPPGLTGALPRLRALADALGGPLEPGHARVEGARDGARVEVAAILSSAGEATGLRIEVSPESGVRVAAPLLVPAGSGPPASWPAEARRVARALARASVSLDPARIVALFEPEGPLEPTLDALLPSIDACLELARALRASAGPFR